MKIDILDRYDGSIIYSHCCDDNTIAMTVEAAVKAGANLTRANLTGAELTGAQNGER